MRIEGALRTMALNEEGEGNGREVNRSFLYGIK